MLIQHKFISLPFSALSTFALPENESFLLAGIKQGENWFYVWKN